MRTSLLAMGLAAALLAGCEANGQEKEDLAESRSIWLDMKAADDGVYQYKRSSSTYSGYRETTTFLVEDDVVVRRALAAYDQNMLVDSWEEQGDEVGSSPNAHPVHTIDELYEICRADVLSRDPDTYDIFLELHDDGVLARCSFVRPDCADGCSEGVDIASLDMSL